MTGQARPRVRFEGVGPDGTGATVAKPWPNVVTELESNRGRYTDLPFMGKTLKTPIAPGSAVQTDPLASVRPGLYSIVRLCPCGRGVLRSETSSRCSQGLVHRAHVPLSGEDRKASPLSTSAWLLTGQSQIRGFLAVLCTEILQVRVDPSTKSAR